MRLRRRRTVPPSRTLQAGRLLDAVLGVEPAAVAVVREALLAQEVPGLCGERVGWVAEAVVHDLRAAGMLSEDG